MAVCDAFCPRLWVRCEHIIGLNRSIETKYTKTREPLHYSIEAVGGVWKWGFTFLEPE